MTDTFVLIIVIIIAILLWTLRLMLMRGSKVDKIAVLPESNYKLDFWEVGRKRLSLVGGLDYFVTVDLEHAAISQLPKQMYANESATVILHPRLNSWEEDASLLILDIRTDLDSKKAGKMLNRVDENNDTTQIRNYALLELTRSKTRKRGSDKYKYLALELLASGFQIAGSIKQKQELGTSVSTYIWNISTERSGIHEIAIEFALEDETGKRSAPIGMINHKIKVVSLGSLTHRQVNIFLAISGVITTLLAILQALRLLGVV